MNYVINFGQSLWHILLESGLWLVVGFAAAGAVYALVPRGWLERQLGGSGRSVWASIVKASLIGIPLPLCSCSVIPVAAGLRRGGAGRGASAAFTISTPQTGEESIPLTWALLGPWFALARPVIAVVTALSAGTLIELFAPEKKQSRGAKGDVSSGSESVSGSTCACASHGSTKEEAHTTECVGLPDREAKTDAPASCCSTQSASTPLPVAGGSCCGGGASHTNEHASHEHAQSASCCAHESGASDDTALAARVQRGLRFGFVTLPRDIALWLVIGLLAAAAISAFVPAGWIAGLAGDGPLGVLSPMLAMLVVGIPLYICATSSTPLAASLVAAGLSPGAALVLLLAGPATNVATIVWLWKELGGRALAIYLATIAAVAVGAGVVFDLLLGSVVVSAVSAESMTHEHTGPWHSVFVVGAIALIALLAWHGVGVLLERVRTNVHAHPATA